MTNPISNSDDIIDSRDVIDRIEELQAEIEADEISEENGAEAQRDEAGDVIVKTATCGTCGKSWNDALISGRTPAPSARCPYEGLHEEIEELRTLLELQEEAQPYSPDWTFGSVLIRDDYFETYAEELADDLGAIDKKGGWPTQHIDWEAAANELKQDYTSVSFDGVDYWIR